MATKTTKGFSIKPKEITKKLLNVLPERNRDILTKRYGLDKNSKRLTLEAIGSEYGITRERVRQIENFGLGMIKKSKTYESATEAFGQIKDLMDEYGSVVHEREFLGSLAKDELTQNHIHFLLVVSDNFTKIKEDEEFHHRWTVNEEKAAKVHQSLRRLCAGFSEDDLIPEPELITKFLKELKDFSNEPNLEGLAPKWLKICKLLARNPLGEWGLNTSPNIRMRGIRDYAYLVLRQNKAPLHFTEVAREIDKTFNKKAHPATCHNELIKDGRFVLVGRGLYALTEWGYSQGTVVDVVMRILKEAGALSKDEIINHVLKERFVKENTILVNLQNAKYFKRDENGRYFLVS
ncbi:MAG TPA: sigma factor-like helix-turn-helix DNA-binding protein [Candidatus Paceibacterota bacterium]|nr:sigma factor-like helix-turn-helix DNA-binding protein [Candidatus Paceibacterota bacterium]